MTYYGLHISEYRACQDCTLCLCNESAGVPAGAAAPVTGAAADEYNLNVVDCNASVTVARRSSLSKNSAAQVVVVSLLQFSSSCSWSMHLLPQRSLLICDFVSVVFVVT